MKTPIVSTEKGMSRSEKEAAGTTTEIFRKSFHERRMLWEDDFLRFRSELVASWVIFSFQNRAAVYFGDASFKKKISLDFLVSQRGENTRSGM